MSSAAAAMPPSALAAMSKRPPVVVPAFSTPATRVRDALMLAFRLALFVWATARIRSCRGEGWFVSAVRCFGWSLVKELLLAIMNSLVLGLAMLATSRSSSQVDSLLELAKVVSWVVTVLNVVAETAFMSWASSCA